MRAMQRSSVDICIKLILSKKERTTEALSGQLFYSSLIIPHQAASLKNVNEFVKNFIYSFRPSGGNEEWKKKKKRKRADTLNQ